MIDKRLLFRSHEDKIENYEWSVPLEEVQSAEAFATVSLLATLLFVVFRDGLRITTGTGSERFNVEEPHSCVRAIVQAKGARG